MIEIPCILFAGGKSSRMGEDKALLPFGTFSTLTEFQYNRLQKIFKHVYISCKSKTKFNFNANFIEDIDSTHTFAPTLGFISSFQYLKCDTFFALSVDTPFITYEIINTLVSKDKQEHDATVAILNNQIQAMCGIYHLSLEKKFLNMLHTNNHKLSFLLKNSNTLYVNFQDSNPFLNLNNKDEYLQALALVNSTLL